MDIGSFFYLHGPIFDLNLSQVCVRGGHARVLLMSAPNDQPLSSMRWARPLNGRRRAYPNSQALVPPTFSLSTAPTPPSPFPSHQDESTTAAATSAPRRPDRACAQALSRQRLSPQGHEPNVGLMPSARHPHHYVNPITKQGSLEKPASPPQRSVVPASLSRQA